MPDIIDIFLGPEFTSTQLTAWANEEYTTDNYFLTRLAFAPAQGMLGTKRTFDTGDIQYRLVSSVPRGAPPSQVAPDRREYRALEAKHFKRMAYVNADEVLDLKRFDALTPVGVLDLLQDKVAKVREEFNQTHEHLLFGLVDGLVLDGDGQTELYDHYDWLGVPRPAPLPVDLAGMTKDTNKMAAFATALKRHQAEGMGGAIPGGAQSIILCGDGLYDAVYGSPERRAAVQLGATGNGRAVDIMVETVPEGAFTYAGITWVNYKSPPGSPLQIPANEGRAFLNNVNGLFETWYAPADTVEQVSNIGLPLYVLRDPKEQTMRRLTTEVQTSPLLVCTRPQHLRRISRT